MAWTPFSAEAVKLDVEIRRLHKSGKISDALDLIKAALDKAHREGPSNISYEDFEAEYERRNAA